MANVTADIEQLLAELVRITTKIAALVNATGTNASDDSDSLTSTANRLSLSATIIAVAAFLIASLQAILEYSSSGESARRKCNVPAIGPLSKYVHKRWSFRHWRWKFYYPLLRLDYIEKFGWDPPTHGRASRILEKLRTIVPLHRRGPTLESSPRATWAQLVASTGVPDESFIMHTYCLDVDSIPGSLDIPPQVVDLVQLGKLVIGMGFDSVSINVQERDFKAGGGHGSITTELITGFGKVVRFQRYKDWFSGTLPASHEWYRNAWCLTGGTFCVHHAYDVEGGLEWPSWVRSRRFWHMINMRNEAGHMVLALKENIQRTEKNTCFDDIYEVVKAVPDDSLSTIFARWQDSLAPVTNRIRYPGILITLAITGLPCAVAGFPARTLLLPFLGQCRQMSQAIYEWCEKASSKVPLTFDYRLAYKELAALPLKEKGLSKEGLSHWAFDVAGCLERSKETKLYMESIREWKPLGGEGGFRQWRMILPPIVDLIKNFDPHSWAQSLQLRESKTNSESDWYTGKDKSDPPALLKMQIILLDTSIYFLLNAIREVYAPLMHYNGDPDYYLELLLESGFFKHVMKAVLKSVASGDDLGPGLFENLDLADPSTKIEDTTTYQQHMTQIAAFLRLRVVLYAAYLMVIPDTSDIFDTELSLGHGGFMLPMI